MNPKPERSKKFRSDLSKIRERGRRMAEGGKFWNPQEGENKFRILPPWNDEGIFYLERTLHYGFKDNTGSGRAYPCLRHFGNAPCPTCQVVARYQGETDADIKKMVQRLKPKGKWFMNIIPRTEGDPVIKIYGATFSVMKPILGYFNDEDYGDITDPDEGRDVTVERDGKGFTTKYAVRIGGKPKPIGVEGWEDNMYNLDNDVDREIIDGPEMLALIEQNYPELDLEGINAGKSKSKAKVQPDDDEGVAPAKIKKSKKSVKPSVEEDEDLLDEDDE